MKRSCFVFLLSIFMSSVAFADTVSIDHFVIKENPFAKDEVAVVATDSLNNIRENVSGIFTFTINGFDSQLKFDKGVAFYPQKLERSSFLYLKHINDSGTHSILYYAYKQDSKITPVHISWMLLVIIPLLLILLGYLFKRFIIIAVVLFLVFLYFNHHNGLNIHTFFESIVDGLKGIFR